MKSSEAHSIQAALDECDKEPIHTPGCVQTCGVLIAFDSETQRVMYASDNTQATFEKTAEQILGRNLTDFLRSQTIHEIRNACSQPEFATLRVPAGKVEILGRPHVMHVSKHDRMVVLELEKDDDEQAVTMKEIEVIQSLMAQIETTQSTANLMDISVKMLRILTGYDRVMAYRFDTENNGEVVAEAKRPSIEPFIGLRFPHWDIPTQARALMERLPLRFIANASEEPVDILALYSDLPPLDISVANLRGVALVHIQYLKNMGIEATMTLSIKVKGRLWGLLSFHHRSARVPSTEIRRICLTLLPLINAKLEALLLNETLALNSMIDEIRGRVQTELDADVSVEGTIDDHARFVLDNFGLRGMMVRVDSNVSYFGECPSERVVLDICDLAKASEKGIWQTDKASDHLEATEAELNGMCGVLCFEHADGRSVALFRPEVRQVLSWAGAPDKDIVVEDGQMRLQPRGSFATYLQEVHGKSEAWLPHDVRLLEGLADTLLAANQRQLVVAAMRRQQDLVIDELNHRVRNILALVRSISRQSRSSSSSIESYSIALERRISALAAAHDLATNKNATPASLKNILELEATPYFEGRSGNIEISGEDVAISVDAAPIVVLVIHELMTNAAKYGALQHDDGRIQVTLTPTQDGATLDWKESNGPPVVCPDRYGFGTTLISQAIPFEIGGESELEFPEDGVHAVLNFPKTILRQIAVDPNKDEQEQDAKSQTETRTPDHAATVLMVEDNFMIAMDLAENLRELGYSDIEIAGNITDAEEVLKTRSVALAVLDINLGRGGTSVGLAHQLEADGTPFFFITGYGELAPLPDGLSKRLKLQKPIEKQALRTAIDTVFAPVKAG